MMSRVASVDSATSPYQTRPAYSVVEQSGPVQLARSVQAIGSALPPSHLPAVQKTLTSLQQNLPLGLLLSVGQPSGSNNQANTDYQSLRNALFSGNLAAAQKAYSRLQSDLEMTPPTPSILKSNRNSSNVVSPAMSNSLQSTPALPADRTTSASGMASEPGSILNAVA